MKRGDEVLLEESIHNYREEADEPSVEREWAITRVLKPMSNAPTALTQSFGDQQVNPSITREV